MAHNTVIPPVDRRTFGHGAFVVQAAEDTRRRAEQVAVNVMIGRTSTPLPNGAAVDCWPTPESDAYGFEAVYDPKRVSLTDAEARVRALLAEHGVSVGHFLNEDGRLTTPQTTLIHDEGLGAWRTARIESAMRDVDDIATPEENAQTPLFAAEIVVTDWKPLAPVQEGGLFRPGGTVDGRFTEMWFHYGTTTGTVAPAKARQIVAEMRAFVDRLEALCDRADEIAADDYEAGA
jgi:hypothetical protein